MNIPKAVERSIASMLRNHAELGADVVLRCWQSLDADSLWDKDEDRKFPMIDIRCSAPRSDDKRNCYVVCSVLCGTKADDDRNHAVISALYGSVQTVLDGIHGGYKDIVGNTYRTEFEALISDELGTGVSSLGGFDFEDSQPPYDDGGVNMIGIGVRVSYGRSDF